MTTCALILLNAPFLFAIFNPSPDILVYGKIRLELIFFAYLFSIWQEAGSGYLRGFGMSLLPAAIAVFGICVFRLIWVATAFQAEPTFMRLMEIYPLSLGATGIAIGLAVFLIRPAKRMIMAQYINRGER